MICKSCKRKVEDLSVYCCNCGVPSETFKERFCVKKILNEKLSKSVNYRKVPFLYYLIIVILLLFVCYQSLYNILNFTESIKYLFDNIAFIIIVSLYFLPFSLFKDDKIEENRNNFNSIFKYYPKILFLTFIIAFYFFLLKLICQGDPILNLARLVLVLWGLSIFFPVLFLIFNKNESVFILIKKAYIAGKYLRWQQFCIVLCLGMLNLIGIIALFIPLIHVVPYTANVMRLWYEKQEEYKLYDKDKDY